MNIKLAQQSRTATYGIALGALVYAVWRGIVEFFAPRNFDARRLHSWRGSL
ncbi:MAG TPA: hypothetical protein VE008_02245 [Burkholderiales bacterium]|nr:hypothetical protein [Burkholderiales bacterium]